MDTTPKRLSVDEYKTARKWLRVMLAFGEKQTVRINKRYNSNSSSDEIIRSLTRHYWDLVIFNLYITGKRFGILSHKGAKYSSLAVRGALETLCKIADYSKNVSSRKDYANKEILSLISELYKVEKNVILKDSWSKLYDIYNQGQFPDVDHINTGTLKTTNFSETLLNESRLSRFRPLYSILSMFAHMNWAYHKILGSQDNDEIKRNIIGLTSFTHEMLRYSEQLLESEKILEVEKIITDSVSEITKSKNST